MGSNIGRNIQAYLRLLHSLQDKNLGLCTGRSHSLQKAKKKIRHSGDQQH